MAQKTPRFRRGDAVRVDDATQIPRLGGKTGGVTEVLPRTNGRARYTVRIDGVLYHVPEDDLQPILARKKA